MKKLLLILSLFSLKSTILTAQIINIEDKRVRLGDSVALKGHLDLGFNLFKNDKQLLTAQGNGQIEYINKRHLLLFLSGYNLIKTDVKNILNDGFSHFRYNYELNKKWVWEGFAQGQYNERTRLRFRGLVGTGLRLKLRFGEKQKFYAGLAYMYEHNQFNDATTRQFDHRMSSYISFTITLNDKVKLVNTLYFQPLLNTLGHARVASQGSLIISFTKRLVYRSTASLTFDNDTRLPPSVPDLTYTWTNGIRWEFGK